jgi:hypothetical protein
MILRFTGIPIWVTNLEINTVFSVVYMVCANYSTSFFHSVIWLVGFKVLTEESDIQTFLNYRAISQYLYQAQKCKQKYKIMDH